MTNSEERGSSFRASSSGPRRCTRRRCSWGGRGSSITSPRRSSWEDVNDDDDDDDGPASSSGEDDEEDDEDDAAPSVIEGRPGTRPRCDDVVVVDVVNAMEDDLGVDVTRIAARAMDLTMVDIMMACWSLVNGLLFIRSDFFLFYDADEMIIIL